MDFNALYIVHNVPRVRLHTTRLISRANIKIIILNIMASIIVIVTIHIVAGRSDGRTVERTVACCRRHFFVYCFLVSLKRCASLH